MSINNGIFQIIGKTVKEIIVNEDCEASSGYHLFIMFDDGSFYEFYGSGRISSAGALQYADAAAYAAVFDTCSTITRFYRDDRNGDTKEDMARRIA